MTRWYRAYEGTVTDAKLGEVALVAGCSRSVAIAAWHCILESCASAQKGGEYETNPRRVAVILGEAVSTIEALFAAFTEIGMIGDGAVTAWKLRQFESDTSTERSRKHRERQRNGDATLQGRSATPPETDTDTDTEKEEVRTRAKPKTDLPDDWEPDGKTWKLAEELGFTAQEAWDQLERMRDWAKNADGGKGRKSDWNAAFRNWLKRTADERRSKPQAPRQRNSLTDSFAILDAVTDEAIRRSDGRGPEGSEEDPFEFSGLRQSAA